MKCARSTYPHSLQCQLFVKRNRVVDRMVDMESTVQLRVRIAMQYVPRTCLRVYVNLRSVSNFILDRTKWIKRIQL